MAHGTRSVRRFEHKLQFPVWGFCELSVVKCFFFSFKYTSESIGLTKTSDHEKLSSNFPDFFCSTCHEFVF